MVGWYAAAATWKLIAHYIVNPALLKLANSTTLRRRLLNVGIALFVVGNVLQFVGSFFD